MESGPPTEQDPLNTGKSEQIGKMEMQRQNSSMVRVGELRQKYQTPAIGTSLIVFLILNVITLIVGLTTINECPIKPIIPIYLAVAGGLGIITKVVPIINKKWFELTILDRVVCALFVIEFIWMILGSVWIYSIYEPPYSSSQGLYCHKTAYLLAFWLLTISYIFLLLMICIPCVLLCCVCCFAICCADSEEP